MDDRPVTIGIVTVRDTTYHPNRRLLEAAARRSVSGRLISPYRLWAAVGASPCRLVDPDGLAAVDVLLPRQGAEIGDASLTLLSHLEACGVPVVNPTAAITLARHQFRTLRALAGAGIPVPDTVLVNSADGLSAAAERLGGYPAVLKQPGGRQGEGVFLAETAADALRRLAADLDPKVGLVVQAYLPPEGRTDIRVLIIGGRVAGAMALTPNPGDFRANYHLTRRSRPLEPPPEVARIATEAAAAVGLDIAGVDIMTGASGRNVVVEVNYAPGFEGLEAATGLDIAGMMVDFVLERIERVENRNR